LSINDSLLPYPLTETSFESISAPFNTRLPFFYSGVKACNGPGAGAQSGKVGTGFPSDCAPNQDVDHVYHFRASRPEAIVIYA
jgi:hypothetical protein